VDTAVWHRASRGGVALWCRDLPGRGLPVLLLHGLAGYAREWDETVSWLGASHRVVAVEQRGHGRSQHRPGDVSRDAFVGDAVHWVEQLGLAPAVVVGQSLGGHTGFLLASRRPDLVGALVVAEATPDVDPDAPGSVRGWLEAWPVPFATRADALAHFGDTPWGRAWTDGLEPTPDGLRPAFDIDVMVDALGELAGRAYWDEWGRISCPTLIVRGADGTVPAAVAQRMADALASARTVAIAGAGHDLHLDRPAAWRDALEGFLGELDRYPRRT
jgi:pimeloyl-ACP methyl ester carboxylesterase